MSTIMLYYTGQGELDHIKLSDFELKYTDIVRHIIESANKQINQIGEPLIDKKFEYKHIPGVLYESGWRFKWFIDASFSGSCKDSTEEWLSK